jgi:hypothetical protein
MKLSIDESKLSPEDKKNPIKPKKTWKVSKIKYGICTMT